MANYLKSPFMQNINYINLIEFWVLLYSCLHVLSDMIIVLDLFNIAPLLLSLLEKKFFGSNLEIVGCHL